MLALMSKACNEVLRKLSEKKATKEETLKVLLLLMQRKPGKKKATKEEPLRVLMPLMQRKPSKKKATKEEWLLFSTY